MTSEFSYSFLFHPLYFSSGSLRDAYRRVSICIDTMWLLEKTGQKAFLPKTSHYPLLLKKLTIVYLTFTARMVLIWMYVTLPISIPSIFISTSSLTSVYLQMIIKVNPQFLSFINHTLFLPVLFFDPKSIPPYASPSFRKLEIRPNKSALPY